MKTLTTIFSGLVLALALGAFTSQNGYQVGDLATDFDLEGVDGKKVSLSDYQNAQGYIVVFTCNTCPYAKMYEDRIKDLHATYAAEGFPVVAINPNCPERSPGDSMAEMKKRAQEINGEFILVSERNKGTTISLRF